LLAIGLFGSIGYIAFDNWKELDQKQNTEIYNDGYKQGLIDATTAVFSQTQNCHPAVLTMGNLTKTIFDYSCLEKETP